MRMRDGRPMAYACICSTRARAHTNATRLTGWRSAPCCSLCCSMLEMNDHYLQHASELPEQVSIWGADCACRLPVQPCRFFPGSGCDHCPAASCARSNGELWSRWWHWRQTRAGLVKTGRTASLPPPRRRRPPQSSGAQPRTLSQHDLIPACFATSLSLLHIITQSLSLSVALAAAAPINHPTLLEFCSSRNTHHNVNLQCAIWLCASGGSRGACKAPLCWVLARHGGKLHA